ncbi:putative Pre-mRNA-splicing factor srp2 [Glarea lozoyensis 74030]|uniref:Putative Pre-mRNA-splicing factor srp2 n=1 Tax=Glarea lozoyensis (strain ATCC 74030 / MF5533) TaxID=1104152 RepID=H0ELP5_GLAL7|nr:putative Pre-mRNA-splicing factor srp2 [Glarea lozoyensis 74030]
MTEVSATRLYLGNLPRNATKADVEAHFNTHGTGEITEIKLMNGFGFIEYKDAMDARDVVPGTSSFVPPRSKPLQDPSKTGRDRDGKGSFVEFETAADLKTAVEKLDGREFKGARVTCVADTQPDVPRDQRRSRSPGRRPYPDDYDRRGPSRGYSPRREGAPLAVATTTTTAEDIALHQELVAQLTTTRLLAADLRIPTVATIPRIHI